MLTQRLAEVSGKLIAVEKDRNLIRVLENFFSKNKNVEVIHSDVLQFNFDDIKGSYKIVANIPYYLTSHLIQVLLNLKRKPTQIVLMVQKEIGERIVAEAGELSVLGISVQIFADAEIALAVPASNFWPKPKVDSCVIVIEPKVKYPEITDYKLFFRIIKIAFAGKRKQIHNTLSNGLKLSKVEIVELLTSAEIEPTMRPQDVSIEKWIALYKRIADSV